MAFPFGASGTYNSLPSEARLELWTFNFNYLLLFNSLPRKGLRMTKEILRFIQNDKVCHSEQSEESLEYNQYNNYKSYNH
jgi:hypothetical protein